MNLKSQAAKLRADFKDPTLHDQACVFAHFVPLWKQHCSTQQMEEILSRFSKGYLAKELEEKVKVADPALKETDFRFVSQATGSWAVAPAVAFDNAEKADLQSQEAELNLLQDTCQKINWCVCVCVFFLLHVCVCVTTTFSALCSHSSIDCTAQARLGREVAMYEEYQRATRAFHARMHEDKVQSSRELQAKLAEVSTSSFANGRPYAGFQKEES